MTRLVVLFVALLALASVARAAEKAVCTVCKEGEEPVAATVVHEGKTLPFCSQGCADTFRKQAKAPADTGAGSSVPSCPI